MAKAQKIYNKANMVCFTFWLNRKYDNDLIEFIRAKENKNKYIRELLYQDSGKARNADRRKD